MSVTAVIAEGHHLGSAHPKWSQSYYFNFYDPKTTLGGFLRIGLLENVQQSNMLCVLFRGGRPAYNRVRSAAVYTPRRMDRGVEVAGLRFVAIEPLRKALVSYGADECHLSLVCEAIHPMADSMSVTKDHVGTMATDIAAAHLEGPVRVSGQLVLRGETMGVDGTGFRDISWGVRNWDALRHYRLAWPLFTNGLAPALLHATSIVGDNVYMKMFHDGEAWRGVQEIEDSIEFDEVGTTVRSLAWRFLDSLERRWEFAGKPIFRFFFPFDGFLVSEHMMEYRLGDGTIGYGLCECGFRLPWTGD